MPTGHAIEDVRAKLFDAAERVLLRDGNAALTSRAITAEAGCAKGVLHRHFGDVDAFIAELILDRVAHVEREASALVAEAVDGTGAVADTIVGVLRRLFSSIATVILEVVIARDAVRARLRAEGSLGIPILAEGTTILADYLNAAQTLGQIAVDVDVETLASTLVGAAHLLYAGRDVVEPDPSALDRMVSTVMAGAIAPVARR